MIKFTCPTCAQVLSASDTAGGTAARCPKCNQNLIVPGAAAAPAARYDSPAVTDNPRARAPEQELLPDRVDDDSYDDRPVRRRHRDEDEDEYPSRRRAYDDEDDYRRGPRCPNCDSPEPPIYKNVVSTAGWITFGILLGFGCWPLCWIGLLIRESAPFCADCRKKIR